MWNIWPFFCGSHIEQPILLLASNLSYFKKVYLVPWSIGRPTWLIWLGQIFKGYLDHPWYSFPLLTCSASVTVELLNFWGLCFSFRIYFLFSWNFYLFFVVTGLLRLHFWAHGYTWIFIFLNCLLFLSVTCGIGLLPFLPGGGLAFNFLWFCHTLLVLPAAGFYT